MEVVGLRGGVVVVGGRELVVLVAVMMMVEVEFEQVCVVKI